MKPINFEYQKIGHIIMIDEKDWNRIVKFLAKNEVAVQEKAVQHRVRRKAESSPKIKARGTTRRGSRKPLEG